MKNVYPSSPPPPPPPCLYTVTANETRSFKVRHPPTSITRLSRPLHVRTMCYAMCATCLPLSESSASRTSEEGARTLELHAASCRKSHLCDARPQNRITKNLHFAPPLLSFSMERTIVRRMPPILPSVRLASGREKGMRQPSGRPAKVPIRVKYFASL